MTTIDTLSQKALSEAAWQVREHARVYGHTKVGCAAFSEDARIHAGCNIEHRFRSHDIHAEVNAISSLVAAGSGRLIAILIAAEREQFTPCGSCLDWIFEVGGDDCLVFTEKEPGVPIRCYTARELMPWYPI